VSPATVHGPQCELIRPLIPSCESAVSLQCERSQVCQYVEDIRQYLLHLGPINRIKPLSFDQ